MSNLKEALIKEAEKRFGSIKPCANKNSINECFTQTPNGTLSLWFNSPDNSTHIIRSNDIAVFDVFKVDKQVD